MFPNLDAEMVRRRITRGMLAEYLHITPTTLSMKLNGKAILTLDECIRIRDIIDKKLTIDYLFASDEDEEKDNE